MKRYMITRCGEDPNSRGYPSGICTAFDTIEEVEDYIKGRNPDYHYQVYEGMCSYVRHVELRKVPLISNSS